jgi:hypothetical protein
MIISYYGNHYIKIQQGDIVMSVNPTSRDSDRKEKIPRFGASIVLSSVNHKDYNGYEQNFYGEQTPLIIDGPGDYESNEILIKGFGTKTILDKKEYINTTYSVLLDGVSLCFLGPLSENLKSTDKGKIESAEILFVSLREDILSPQELYKLAVSFEPNIIIPVDYTEKTLNIFLKEAGNTKPETFEKLTLKKKDIYEKQGEVILIKQE